MKNNDILKAIKAQKCPYKFAEAEGVLTISIYDLAAVIEQFVAREKQACAELNILLHKLRSDLDREKDYSQHYERKFHEVAGECADLASAGVGTLSIGEECLIQFREELRKNLSAAEMITGPTAPK